MATNETIRLYNFGDDVLMQKADKLIHCMQRDADAFATRMIDGTKVDEVVRQNEEFKNIPTDSELLGLISAVTEQKNVIVLEIRKLLSTVRSMAETKYGNSAKYRIFNFGTLSELPDSELYRTSKRVVRVGTNLLSELSTEGLTAAILSQIAKLATTHDDNLDKMEEAIENRDIKKQERVICGNKLWALMVKYANVGKSLFEQNDEARYNDYVLTDGSSTTGGSEPTPPTP